ncbi:MAG: hypothetical protein P9E88_14350 [Candidatus Competibacter sp.]|nr:hypothetical protein [Candidatus Competibacter sp.]
MSNSALFAIDDPVELLALWRLVAEAKFQPNPEDSDLWGSPYVHVLAQRISDALLYHAQSMEDTEAVKRHKSWIASLQTNAVLPTVKLHLKKDAAESWWAEKSMEEKIAYVKGCIAPFEADADFIEGLIHGAEV